MLADRINTQRIASHSELRAAEARADALRPEKWDAAFALNADEETLKRLAGEDHEGMRKYRDSLKAYRDAVAAYCDLIDAAKAEKAFVLSERSMDEKYIVDFKEKLHRAQKFRLSPQFAITTLEKLATPETVVKSREFFNLAHNPMWLEWHYDEEGLRGLLEGALVFTEAAAPEGEVLAYLFNGVRGHCTCKLVRFYPDTLRLEDDDMNIDWGLVSGAAHQEGQRELEIDMVTDFIIRINSPRITEIRQGKDLTALNKKRARNGKLPLYQFLTVELSEDVKRGLKMSEQADTVPEGHRRLHWRRGHFKCCRTGLFWWNPHVVGKRELGVIEKHYAA